MFFFKKLSPHFYQLLATILGDLQILSYGLMFGITPSALILYQSEQTPLDDIITEDEASWITSYLCLGGILGTILLGYSSEKWGRKPPLLFGGILQIFGWGFLLFGHKIWHIFMSRFLVGAGSGGAYIILPIYVSEIAEDQYRGSLGSYISTLRSLGVLIGFIFGAYLDYDLLIWIGSGIAVAFSLTFPFMPESPYFHAARKDIPMMEKSLRWLRGVRSFEDRMRSDFINDVEKFRKISESFSKENNNREENNSEEHKVQKCCPFFMFRIFLIAFVLITTSQFCGVFAVLNYANVIFSDIKSGFSPNESGIILAVMQFLSTYLGTLIADRFNRKVLISTTSFGAGLSLIGFGAFIYLRENQIMWLEDYKWIPLICLCLTIVLANMGLYPLTFVVISEIFPKKIKGKVMTIFLAYLWLLAFLSVKYYYILTYLVGIYGCIWIFAGFCIFEFIFTIIFIPETRGKSLEDIQNLLSYKKEN